jgi:hypothetical protein
MIPCASKTGDVPTWSALESALVHTHKPVAALPFHTKAMVSKIPPISTSSAVRLFVGVALAVSANGDATTSRVEVAVGSDAFDRTCTSAAAVPGR